MGGFNLQTPLPTPLIVTFGNDGKSNPLSLFSNLLIRGGDLGGTAPQKTFEVGDGPYIRPPNILRSNVVGYARKYEE